MIQRLFDTANKVLDKVLGGRFILTVLCGYAFLYGVRTKYISAESALLVIVLVFEWYFKREDRKKEGNGTP